MTAFAPGVCRFLLANITKLDPEALSNYLSLVRSPDLAYRRSFLNLFVLSAFDFRGVAFEWAFRAFLAVMWLPRSSKAIDRMFHAFALTYTSQHPGAFKNAAHSEEGMCLLRCLS